MNIHKTIYSLILITFSGSMNAQDVQDVLERASQTMGVDEMVSIQYK
ncbi:MAG: hypothetical protein HKN08_08625, partial [Gammaproteobacteria bacterium]|nr:hypothetical protein [Gammaproteobacteria bacterium]